MNVKETKGYIAVDCGLPADTFNIITLLNNNVTENIEKLYKEVVYYNQKEISNECLVLGREARGEYKE